MVDVFHGFVVCFNNGVVIQLQRLSGLELFHHGILTSTSLVVVVGVSFGFFGGSPYNTESQCYCFCYLHFFKFFVPRLKGFHMVLQACHSEAIAFLLWALFGGGLESVVLATFFRFGKIFEQSILFSYMAAYGATSVPTNSVKQLLPLAGPLLEALRQFLDIGRKLCSLNPKPQTLNPKPSLWQLRSSFKLEKIHF